MAGIIISHRHRALRRPMLRTMPRSSRRQRSTMALLRTITAATQTRRHGIGIDRDLLEISNIDIARPVYRRRRQNIPDLDAMQAHACHFHRPIIIQRRHHSSSTTVSASSAMQALQNAMH